MRSKKTHNVVLSFVVVFVLVISCLSGTLGFARELGEYPLLAEDRTQEPGSAQNPHRIMSAEDFLRINTDGYTGADTYFLQESDFEINITNCAAILNFKGVYDGGGYTIFANFAVDATLDKTAKGFALFGNVGSGGATKAGIKNLTVVTSGESKLSVIGSEAPQGDYFLGGLVANLGNSFIKQCKVGGSLAVSFSTIYNTDSESHGSGRLLVGAVAGRAQDSAEITDVISEHHMNITTTISNPSSWSMVVGGIAGELKEATIKNALLAENAVVDLSPASYSDFIGGIAGIVAAEEGRTAVEDNVVLRRANPTEAQKAYEGAIAGAVFVKSAEAETVVGKHYGSNILAGEVALYRIDGAIEEQILAENRIISLSESKPEYLQKQAVATDYRFASTHCDRVEKGAFWPEWDMLAAPRFNMTRSQLSNKGSLSIDDGEYPNYVAFSVDEKADIQGLNYRVTYTSLAKYPINTGVLGYSVNKPTDKIFTLSLGINADNSEVDPQQAQVWYNLTPDDQNNWRAARDGPMILGFSGEERALDVQIRSQDSSSAASEVGRIAVDKYLNVSFSGEDQGTVATRRLAVFSGGDFADRARVADGSVYIGIDDYINQHHNITVEAFFKMGDKTSDAEQFIIVGDAAPSMVQLLPADGKVLSTERITATGIDFLSDETVYYAMAVGGSNVSAPKLEFTSDNMLIKDTLIEFPLEGLSVDELLTGGEENYLQIRTITVKEDRFGHGGELYSAELVFDFQLTESETQDIVTAVDSIAEAKKTPYHSPVISAVSTKDSEKEIVMIASPEQLPTVLRPDFYSRLGEGRQYTFEEIAKDPNGAYGVIQVAGGATDPLQHKAAIPGIFVSIGDLDSGDATEESLLEGTLPEVRYYRENTMGNLVENIASRYSHEVISLKSDGENSQAAVMAASLVPSGPAGGTFTKGASGILPLASGAPTTFSAGYFLEPTPREPTVPFDWTWQGTILVEKDRDIILTSTDTLYYIFADNVMASNLFPGIISQIAGDNITDSFIKKYVPTSPASPIVIAQPPDYITPVLPPPDIPEISGVLYIFRDRGAIIEQYAVCIMDTDAAIPQATGALAQEGILEMNDSITLFTPKNAADASIFYTVSSSLQTAVKPEVVINPLGLGGTDKWVPKNSNTKKYTGAIPVSSISTGVPGSEMIITYLITENKNNPAFEVVGNVSSISYTLKNQVGNITPSLPTGATANAGQTVTLTTPTLGAEIYYTVSRNDAPPARPWKDTSGFSSTKYTGPIIVETPEVGKSTFQVSAIAFKDSETESSVETFVYNVISAGQHTITAEPASGSVVPKGTVVRLATNYSGADGEIRYTMVNRPNDEPPIPTLSDAKYSAAGIVINQETILCAALFINGDIATVEYFSYSATTTNRAQKPKASLADNTVVANNTKVTFSTTTSGADIYYTLDGTTPEEGMGTTTKGRSAVIKGNTGDTVVVKLYAAKDGMNDSETATYYYEVNKIAGAAVTANPADGELAIIGSMVQLQCNVSGAQIYYTTDGSQPDTNSKKGKSVAVSGKKGDTLEINAVAELDGYYSKMHTFTYELVEEIPEKAEEIVAVAPLIDPPGANIAPGTTVEKGTALKLLAKAGTIHYTLDGTNPTEESQIYTSPIIIDASVMIKAIAAEGGALSKTATFHYGVAGQVEVPMANHSGGEIVHGTEIALSTATPGARIYYSTDGSQPIAEDIRNLFEYTAPFPINNTVVIKVIALKDGMTPSPVTSIEYTVVAKMAASAGIDPESELEEEETTSIGGLSTQDKSLKLDGPKYTDVVMRDPETQLVVSAKEGVLPKNARIVIVREENPSSRDREAVINALNLDLESLYSVKIVLEDGTEIQPTAGEMAEIGVRIPIGYENAALVLCRINENGAVEAFDTRRSGDMAYAEIEYFSHKFAIAISGLNESGDTSRRDIAIRAAIVLASAGIVGYLGYEVIQLRKKRLENES